MAGHVNFQVSRNKSFKGKNIFEKNRIFNKNDSLNKSDKIMNGIAVWASFYRANPHRFVKDYFGIDLKLFQKIFIYFMNHYIYVIYLASRGQGKSFLTAIYCCVRCCLYPETKVIIASGNRKQATGVIEKIDEMRKNSPNLAREISDLRTSLNDAKVDFHNGSWIKVVSSNQGSRYARANLLVVDEFRMVDLPIINKVLRKFLTSPRQPKYLSKPEYAHMQERNKEIYLSSCWYKFHWSWEKVKAYFKAMTDGKGYFIAGLPYQLSIKEGLLMKDQVLDEMSEDDFDQTGWEMEMECMFFGESEKAFFNYEDIKRNRVLPNAIFPKDYYGLLKDKEFKYIPKKPNEIRLISCDIAGMAGNANDASAYTIFRLLPIKNIYERHIVYMESMVGGHTVTQATRIRQLYEDYDCNFIVLDTQSMGLGIYDQLCRGFYDEERKIEYEAFSCINDETMAERCVDADAPKVIYSIKGNEKFNSDCALTLKDCLKRNKIKLLIDESEGKEFLERIKGYESLPIEQQVKFQVPYLQITFLMNEMINLEGERKDSGYYKLKEKSGRKDRYSSVSYGNFIASQLEQELLKSSEESNALDYLFFN